MNKIIKFILCGIIAVLIIFGACACSTTTSDIENTDTTVVEETPVESIETEAETVTPVG